jgi:ribonuclease VapC
MSQTVVDGAWGQVPVIRALFGDAANFELATSALIAILRDEPEALSCAQAIENSSVRRVSAANFVEVAVIIDASCDPVASRRFDDLIKEAQIIIEPLTEPQARIAREAYRDFGKGSSHPAKLNFGDCFAYALAKFTGEPLLSKATISRTPTSNGNPLSALLRQTSARSREGVAQKNDDGS